MFKRIVENSFYYGLIVRVVSSNSLFEANCIKVLCESIGSDRSVGRA